VKGYATLSEEDMTKTTGEKPRKAAYAHLFRLSHWLLSAGMLLLIVTGFGVHSVAMPAWALIKHYPSFYPELRIILWHKIIGIIFAPASIIALVYFLPRIKKIYFSNLRRIAAILLLVAGAACVITGLGLIYTNIPDWLYHLCRFIHAVCGMIVAPAAILIHIYLALFKYLPLIVPSFAPARQASWSAVVWLALGLVVSWGLFTRFIPMHSGASVLTALKIGQQVSDAKQVDSLPWARAQKMTVKLVNGVGFDFGVTDVVMQALYNDEYVYMKFQWKDEVYNRDYRPWVKTDKGWAQMNPGGADEVIYNEDKLALLFPIDRDIEFERYGCAVYCHNNQKTGRGQHWTYGNRRVDVWHWKSVRLDPAGYVDDQYWLGTGKVSIDKQVRLNDPGEAGYGNNRVEGVSRPIMLPASMDAVVKGALFQSKGAIYTKALDEHFPEGSVVPGVIVDEPTQDRADIKCYSSYEENRWTLRIMRKLDTGSAYDVLFKPGNMYPFTLAAFDHNANRHSYNQQVYRLYFAQ
jgi:hypothetical protein